MKLKILILEIVILLISIFFNFSFAQEKILVESDMIAVEKGQKFNIAIKVEDSNICATSLKLFYDESKIEFVKGPDNSNRVKNAIIFIWFDETGGRKPLNNGEIASFEFIAKETGTAEFNVKGEFYNQNEEEIDRPIENRNIEIIDSNINKIIKEKNVKEYSINENTGREKIKTEKLSTILPEIETKQKIYKDNEKKMNVGNRAVPFSWKYIILLTITLIIGIFAIKQS